MRGISVFSTGRGMGAGWPLRGIMDEWRADMGCRPVTAGTAIAGAMAGIILAFLMSLPG